MGTEVMETVLFASVLHYEVTGEAKRTAPIASQNTMQRWE